MMDAETAVREFRLDGLEPDNLLAFLALLGMLRALDAAEAEDVDDLRPRVSWALDSPPLRPLLHLARPMSRGDVTELIDRGIELIAPAHDFGERRNLDYNPDEAREVLLAAAYASTADDRGHVDLLSALMSDGAIRTKQGKGDLVDPTPLCLQFGQGGQYFLERLNQAPRFGAPAGRGRGRARVEPTSVDSLEEALFHPWQRVDLKAPTLRWDPAETARHALMAGDPQEPEYKLGSQHGANRLAAVGLAALTVVPRRVRGRMRAVPTGGEFDRGFSFAWPIWRDPISLLTIRNLLAHSKLRSPGALAHLGVAHVQVARRISVGKYMSITRAQFLPSGPVGGEG